MQAGIHAMRIAAMRLPQTARQGVLAFGHHDQVHVVGHKAIADQPETCRLAILGDQAEIGGAIDIVAKDVLAVVAALRDVVGQSGSNDPSKSGHDILCLAGALCLGKMGNT